MKKVSHSGLNQLRGYPIYEKNGEWFYCDTGEQTAGNRRRCGFCGRLDTTQGHDGCLGHIPNVRNACCGHGHTPDAYVQFTSRKPLGGVKAKKFFKDRK